MAGSMAGLVRCPCPTAPGREFNERRVLLRLGSTRIRVSVSSWQMEPSAAAAAAARSDLSPYAHELLVHGKCRQVGAVVGCPGLSGHVCRVKMVKRRVGSAVELAGVSYR